MTNRILKNELKIDKKLFEFINNDILPGTNIDEEYFWNSFSDFIIKFTPINKYLLKKRSTLQKEIDSWHKRNIGNNHNTKVYENFLRKIDYIVDEKDDFKIETENIDEEISNISGPQLVVPITNSRYALNAVNARWGSLYDALYGTDVLGDLPMGNSFDPKRGTKVIEFAKNHLDNFAPLENISWAKIIKISLEDNKLKFYSSLKKFHSLSNLSQLKGYILNNENHIKEIILEKNNLHIRIIIDSKDNIGKNDPANICDLILESAISTILDCEDSVATVDAEDKILAYKNLLGLMKGDLNIEFTKNHKVIKRSLHNDIKFKKLTGNDSYLRGRSLMLIRNVGHLMTTPAILNQDGSEIGEGLMDAVITSLISVHDITKKSGIINSLNKSIYIVKPKMHGPEEVKFANDIFESVEKILNLKLNTIKIGIMDEERRTSVNLKECIRAAKNRVAFINTGFLDRTGDEIHTSMHAGPFLKKGDMKSSSWINSYEKRNVAIGLKCGLQGRAQIGKGMWAMPDLMRDMMDQKINHLKSGANCAWVPSPTAATLHSMHYHKINVKNIQESIIEKDEKLLLSDLLKLPLLEGRNLSEEEILLEIENNAQGILGYVVRWIDQGIGCSKVLDINNVGLMEDRATCRISSQAISNWLLHQIVSKEQVISALKKMAIKVDNQNNKDINYKPMSEKFDTIAFKAAYDLIFLGLEQPSGYTEPILHKRRLELKKL